MGTIRNLSRMLDRDLEPAQAGALRKAAGLAETIGARVYLVGGSVRDLLLGAPSLDLDLVVEGDGPGLATALAEALGGRVTAHSTFGTAQVKARALTIDVATARKERYPHPGALPVVTSGTLMEDLLRRDFSVHAMACSVMPGSWGELIDPCEGQHDLDQRVLRVIHDRSFVDDPTRVMRAIRYSARLRFSLEARTEQLLVRDRFGLRTISGARRWKEVRRVLEEQEPERALLLGDRLGVLRCLHPALEAGPWLAAACIRARRTQGLASAQVYFCLLTCPLNPADLEDLLAELRPPASFRRPSQHLARLSGAREQLRDARLSPSQAVQILDQYDPNAVRALHAACEDPELRTVLASYLFYWSQLGPRLSARHLMEMGVPQGPELGRYLDVLRSARLDGVTGSVEDETDLVRTWRKDNVGR